MKKSQNIYINIYINKLYMDEFDSVRLGYKIPNIIHQTFINRSLPPEIAKIILHNKKICPQCKFVFYDDEDCDNFIKNNFDTKVYSAYKKINDVYGAMKADFFRYCVLYKIGGIYLDIKSLIKFPLFKIIKKNDICVLDKLRNDKEPYRTYLPTYEQWLLIFAPNHPYLLEMINTMVHYIEIKYVPNLLNYNLDTKGKILHVTGPDAFTKAINQCIKKDGKILHRSINYDRYFELNVLGDNYKKMYGKYNKKHYSQYNEPLYK
jgi:mannosyltransferase OCH1-like enzyme